MHQEIGVAPDGRSEVYVRVERQAEVAGVVRAVHRLLERAQQYRLQESEVRALLDLLEELRIVARARDLAAGKRKPQLGEEVAQSGDLLRRRHIVHAIEGGVRVLGKEAARADVGRE